MEDDEYQGHVVPGGSMIVANIWYDAFRLRSLLKSFSLSGRAMTRDERLYKSPEEFNPERFAKGPKGGEESAVTTERDVASRMHLPISPR